MSRRDKKKQESGGGAPGWMTTFSDLMSLLLTFFILLYSMSSIDAAKFKSMSESLQAVLSGGQPTIIEGQESGEPIPNEEEEQTSENVDSTTVEEEILVMHEKVKKYIEEEKLDAVVTVSMNKRGVFVEIKEAILFESGSAQVKESGLVVLKKLEGIINEFENNIVIEGHTDNIPMTKEPYRSNWELSTARAVSVVRHLSEVENVSPNRLSATGYGEYKPIAPNDTTENRRINRRVNILIVFDESEDVNGKTGGN